MPYTKASDAQNAKQQICAVFNNNDNCRALANLVGIKKITVYR